MPKSQSEPRPFIPDPLYYLAHFMEVIEGVETRYGFLLSEPERAHIATLRALPQSALCLYVRLCNRKGPFFRCAKLDYAEIGCPETALRTLIDAGLLERIPDIASLPAEMRAALWDCFPQSELMRALKPHLRAAGVLQARLIRKPDLCAWLLCWEEAPAWSASWLDAERVVRLSTVDPWCFLRFLFFGEMRENLSGFVTRELGHIVPETHAALAPCFVHRAEAEACYAMERCYAEFRRRRVAAETALELLHWWRGLPPLECAETQEKAWPSRHRLVARLGRLLESEGAAEEALALYDAHPLAPVRERQLKLLVKRQRPEAARALAAEMLAAPRHAEERYAAEQVLARLDKTARRSHARTRMLAGPALALMPEDGVEACVLAHYTRLGWQGVHGENWLWNAFFGLFLWDIVYDASSGAFHQPLQMAPADLYQPGFYLRRAPAIEARLAKLADRTATRRRLMQTHQAKEGLSNPFVGWHEQLLPLLMEMVERLPVAGMAAVLRRMAQDVKRHQRGFPDLFLWRDREYRFLEVKSPNDQLSPHQFHWLEFFREHGLEADIQRVEWLSPTPALRLG